MAGKLHPRGGANRPHRDERKPVEPRKQTHHKLDVMRRYYQRYLSIIAKANEKKPGFRGDNVFLVDLFAGAGRHLSAENPLGEVPGTAALACHTAREVQNAHQGTKVHVRLSDLDQSVCHRLEAQVSDYVGATGLDHVDVTISASDYEKRMAPIITETMYGSGRHFCSLWLIDPDGISIPLETLRPILETPNAELIINLDAGAARREIMAVTNPDNKLSSQLRVNMSVPLDQLFGGSHWRRVLSTASNLEQQLEAIAVLYQEAFSGFFKHRSHHKLRPSRGQHRYLIHLTNHPKGPEAFEKDYQASLKTGYAKGRALDWNDRGKISERLMLAFAGQEMSIDDIQAQATVPGLTRQQAKVIFNFACVRNAYATLNKDSRKLTWNRELSRTSDLPQPPSKAELVGQLELPL